MEDDSIFEEFLSLRSYLNLKRETSPIVSLQPNDMDTELVEPSPEPALPTRQPHLSEHQPP